MNNLQITGVALATASFALLMLSRVQLGKSFSVGPQAKELVTHGIYRRIRNPMYVFVDLTIAGIVLATGWWYALAILVILAPLQAFQARRERRVLADKFCERYEAYRRGTWF